jgi:hypothetical protein
MVQDPMNNGPQPVNRGGWGWNRDPWGAGCGWFVLFWIVIICIFAGWGWWGGWGGGWGNRGWNNGGNVPQAASPVHVTNNYYFGGGADEFLGKTITLKGKIERVYGKQVFTVTSEEGAGPYLLVVANQKGTPKTPLKKGEEVEVMGTVERFNRADFEKQTKADLATEHLAAFRQRPAILATSVKVEHPVSTETPKKGG